MMHERIVSCMQNRSNDTTTALCVSIQMKRYTNESHYFDDIHFPKCKSNDTTTALCVSLKMKGKRE